MTRSPKPTRKPRSKWTIMLDLEKTARRCDHCNVADPMYALLRELRQALKQTKERRRLIPKEAP